MNISTRRRDDSEIPLKTIRRWFDDPHGRHVLATESAIVDQLLPAFFGYHLLQVSIQNQPLFTSSQVQHKSSMGILSQDPGAFVGSARQLPFEDDSIDVVLLHHILDFYQSPQEILREVTRVTLPQGHLVIVGFNPISSWGMWQPIGRLRGSPPWTGSFVRPGRLMDWLNLLDFQIDRAQYSIYYPPIERFAHRPVPDFSHGLSRRLNWPFGAVYVIVARKQVTRLRPIRPVWRQGPAMPQLTVVRPARRDVVSRDQKEP